MRLKFETLMVLLIVISVPLSAQGLILALDEAEAVHAIDSLSGIGTQVGGTGFNGATGCLARDDAGDFFTIAGGLCNIFGCSGTSRIYRIDPATGVGTPTGVSIPGYYNFNGLAIVGGVYYAFATQTGNNISAP